MTEEHSWRSYDAVADTYERVAVPAFAALAGDLIAKVGLSKSDVVLDVGTGTGLTAELASDVVAPHGVVVGIDPSEGMLRVAHDRRQLISVCAGAPGLPFADASFDAVVANLVLSHLPDISSGLADMIRVLRAGGRLGVTAWGPNDESTNNDRTRATEIVTTVRENLGIPATSPVKGVPWEELLKSRDSIEAALTDAGLVEVDLELHTYQRTVAVEEHLAGWTALSRYQRWAIGEERWLDFTERATAALRRHFGETLVDGGRAWIAVGVATGPITP